MRQLQTIPKLSHLERALLDRYQRDFPLDPEPFQVLANEMEVSIEAVETALQHLLDLKIISRVGAVVAPHKTGWSTLAALSVPADCLEEVAELVNGYSEVNHNYERAHDYNLWFVVTASDRKAVDDVLADIERHTGLVPLNLPMEEAFHIDLGFKLQWN